MQTQVAENPTGQVIPSPATVAAADLQNPNASTTSPQTSPARSPAQTDTASGSKPNDTQSEYDPTRSRLLSKGWEPRFWPKPLHREFQPSATPAAEVPAEDTVQLDYELVLRGGREEIVRVKSQLILPMALEVENLAQTDVSFPQLVDQVIVRPLVTKFRSFLQKRFDAASAAEAKKRSEAEPPPSLPANNVKLPKPANGVSYPMPPTDAKLPTARMPGGYGNLKP